MFGNYNPYYNNYMQPRMDPQFVQQPVQPTYKQPSGLQGKSVDSLEVVKAMDIPLDGSTSYFPLIDGSAIITKQLKQDGTSKIVIFKPVEDTVDTQVKYVTPDELDKALEKVDNSKELQSLKEELKSLRRKMRFFVDDKKEE